MRMGNNAFRTPSTNAHHTSPPTDWAANCWGSISMAGATSKASRMVTTNVMKALLWPAILKPSIKTKSNKIGTIAIKADIRLRFYGVSITFQAQI